MFVQCSTTKIFTEIFFAFCFILSLKIDKKKYNFFRNGKSWWKFKCILRKKEKKWRQSFKEKLICILVTICKISLIILYFHTLCTTTNCNSFVISIFCLWQLVHYAWKLRACFLFFTDSPDFVANKVLCLMNQSKST